MKEFKGLMDIIRARRSIRHYSDSPVEEEKIKKIIEAARLAPSSSNSQCWRFIVVKDKHVKEQLVEKGLSGKIVPGQWAKTAPVIIVACAQLSFMTHRLGAAVKNIEYRLLDMGIAVEHLVLRATELGLGTCWIGWFNERWIRKILKIPRSIKIVALVTLGYPVEDLKLKEKKRLSLEEILFFDKYGKSP